MDVCPVGAITSRFAKYKFRPWQEEKTQTTCTYCGCGCQYELRSVDGEASRVTPVEGVGPGQGSLCVRGHFGFHFMEDERRLTRPLVRRGDKLVEADWDTALTEVARGLANAKAAKGGNAVAGLVGGRLTNEEIYLFTRLIRNVVESSNLDSSLRYGGINGVTVMREALGVTGMMNSFDDLRKAGSVLLVGSDITREAPICGLAVKETIQKGTGKVLTVDFMKTEIMKLGAGRLQIKPGTEMAVIKGLVKAVVDEGLIDPQVARDYPEAVAAIRDELSGTFKEIETPTGLKKDDIVALARQFAAAENGIILAGPRVTGGLKGASQMAMLVDLAFLTGNLKPGAGVNALTAENNELGLALMGAAPELLPGGLPWSDDAARARLSKAWNCELPDFAGANLLEMIESMQEGRINALYVAGANPAGSLPQNSGITSALKAVDFLVVQDIFLTETARHADVVLPACSYAEKDGTFTNMEGRVQEIHAAMKAPGRSRTDWQIISGVARAMGFPLEYESAAEIRQEMAGLVPQVAQIGVTNAARHADTAPALAAYLTGKYRTGMASRYDLPAKLNAASDYGMTLYLGDSLYHSGKVSTYNWGLMKIDAVDRLILNGREARKLGIQADDRVKVTSELGSATVQVGLDGRVPAGSCFFPVHHPGSQVRDLVKLVTGSGDEGDVPQFRLERVSVEKV
jgi:formate dehydrogenase alpha subunit